MPRSPGFDEAELSQVPAYGVDKLGSLPDQQLAHPVHRQCRLLLFGLDRHDAHGRPRHGLADCGGVGRVVLATLHVRLDVLRRHEPHLMPKGPQLARPEVRGGAGLHADQAGWQRSEIGDDLAAPEAALDDDVARLVHAVDLEDVLGQVEADRCNLHGGWLLLGDFDSHQLGTTMPRGGHPPHQIQALDRTQPGLPIKKGRAGTMTHDYIRHGTTTLFAALNVLDGSVIGQCMARHRHQEFIRFLNRVEAAVPAGKLIHAILDNYAAHKHPKVRAWLARHPRWTFHFTPTSCSWLNAVETFFATLTRRRLQRGAFHSLVDLQAAINRYLAEHNQRPKPFVWTADPNRIIEKVNRGHQALASDH